MTKNTKTEIIDTIKLLIYKEDPILIEKINFEDDNTFLDPLLFSYFNSKKENLISNKTLAEILQGYFLNKEGIKTQYSFNKNDIAYIPKVGYYKRGDANPYESILREGDFEIVKEIHSTQEKYFVETYKGNTVNENPVHNPVWKDHYQELFKAISIIKKHLPDFYKELAFANKKNILT